MAHGITEQDTAWFFHQPAWHGLGTVAKKRPKTAQEWLKQAGLDWKVELQPVVTMPSVREVAKGVRQSNQLVARLDDYLVDGHLAVVRKDLGAVLGMVTPTYEPHQNADAFALLEGILGEVVPETAFSLWGGKQVGALTRIPDHVEVGGDEVRTYIYLRTRHDGSGALWFLPTSVRVVCANTDRMAIAAAGGQASELIHKIRHVGDKSVAIAKAREALKLTIDLRKQFKKEGDKLARVKMPERTMKKVLDELYPAGTTDRAVKASERTHGRIMDLFLRGDTVGNAPGSRWSAYNALIEYDQHVRPVRSKDDDVRAERRFVRAFEDPDNFQRRALELVAS